MTEAIPNYFACVRLFATREIWFGIGYTFANFEGLTPETAGGLYLRLDLVTGGQL